MNNHIYASAFTQTLLNFMLTSPFFDSATPNIFCFESTEHPFNALKNIIEKMASNHAPDKIAPIENLISGYNEKSKDPINAHVVARLCQSSIQNGRIIPLNNLDAHTAWLIFLNTIKETYTTELIDDIIESKKQKKLYILPEKILSEFLNFLGELCHNDLPNVAEIFHNYLHLSYRITRKKESNLMSETYMAQMMSATFIDALELSEKIMPQKFTEGNWNKLNACKQELQFMSCFTLEALQHPLFSKPFTPEDYISFRQKKGTFHTTQANLYQRLWNNPDMTMVPTFSEKTKERTEIQSRIKKSTSFNLSLKEKDKPKEKKSSPEQKRKLPLEEPNDKKPKPQFKLALNSMNPIPEELSSIINLEEEFEKMLMGENIFENKKDTDRDQHPILLFTNQYTEKQKRHSLPNPLITPKIEDKIRTDDPKKCIPTLFKLS